MGKPTGFLEYKRETAKVEAPKDRIKHFNEFRTPLKKEEQQKQGARCMECGVPVGVIFATEVGYKVLGLAFVERFEPENGWFVLHGPVHKGGPDPRFASDMSYLKHMPVDIEFAGQGATDDEIWLWRSFTIVLFDRIAWRCNLAHACRCMLFLICIARGERT